MPIEIRMPALSPTMKSGAIKQWHKNEGDKVQSGDIIADILTDKATMEFEYIDEDGIMGKILVPKGTKNVPVNTVIALIAINEKDMEEIKTYRPSENLKEIQDNNNEIIPSNNKNQPDINDIEKAIPKDNNTIDQNITDNKQRIKISPVAKKIAMQSNINLKHLKGTGPYGRIIKDDILSFINKTKNDNIGDPIQEQTQSLEISEMRKIIASRLLESKQSIPHFYLTIDCKVNELLKLKDVLNNSNRDLKITVNDFIIKAVSLSMKAYPDVNSSWVNEKLLYYNQINIAIAVALKDGLITPIIKNADHKTLSQISKEMKNLAKRARDNELKPEEFQGGGFTISNLGMYGINSFSAIINPPQSCIMAVGKTEKRPIVNNDTIIIANMLTITLSVDHRVVDGALGAQFLNTFKNYMENPCLMLA